jgi:hypothetical protein
MSYRVRYLIAQLQWVTAQATHDLYKFGEWQCDYGDLAGGIQRELDDIFKKEEKAKMQPSGGQR